MRHEDRQTKLLQHIATNHGVTRNDLADSMNLNITTVTKLVANLIDQNFIQTKTNPDQTRGRPTETLHLNPNARYTIGLEFGRKHLMGIVVDACGEPVFHNELRDVPEFEAKECTIMALADRAKLVAEKAGIDWERVTTVGLALHDVVDAHGRWSLHNQTNDAPFEVRPALENYLNRTCVIEDVSRSFAYAEQLRGAGSNKADSIYVFTGKDGVGGGIFVNNRLLKSSTGVCGELGHIVVEPGGKRCHCGAQGCLETVATPAAITERYHALARQGVATSLPVLDITFERICMAAAYGDKAAYLVLDELAEHMAKALAATVNISGATYIIVGGPLKHAGESFRNSLESALKRQVIGALLPHIRVQYALLPDYAGAWGVALQALELAFLSGEFLQVFSGVKQTPVLQRGS